MKFEWKRLLAMVMTLAMVFTMLPVNVMAAGEQKSSENSVNFGAAFQDDEPSQQSGGGSGTVTVGDTITLTGTASTKCGYSQWNSSDAGIAAVNSSGVVTGVAQGEVTITHTYCTSDGEWHSSYSWYHDYQYETFTVTVVPAILTGLEISGGDAVDVGASLTLNAVRTPAGAADTLYWSSSDNMTLAVDGNGVVTGLKAGTATVTVSNQQDPAEEGSITAAKTITVNAVEPSITVTPENTAMSTVGQTQQMTAAVTGFANYIVTWESSNPDLVSISSEGVATVKSGTTAEQSVTITATATSLDDATQGQTVTGTATVTVQFGSYNLYFYALIPGKSADDSENADQKWFGLGVAKIQGVENPANLSTGTRPTGYSIDTGDVVKALYPNITYNGVTYRYAAAGTENASKEGYYTLAPMRVTVAYGANAGFNGYNPTASGNTYHYDHTIVLNEKDICTVNFKVMDPGFDTFAALDGYAQRVDSGTSEASLNRPTMDATKVYDGITYRFDGWYTDSACTQQANFDGTVTANISYYGKYVPTNARYTVEYYYDGVKNGSKTETGGPLDIGTIVDSYTNKPVSGYVLQGTENLPLTITANEADNVIKVYYVKNANLSYTVRYYLNGTTDSVQSSDTVNGQVFDTSVTLSPADIAGYTPVSTASQTITIGANSGENLFTFYYYKNVTLTANSDTRTYNGQLQSVEGYTGAPEGVTFEGITASGSGVDVDEYPVAFGEGTIGKKDTSDKYIVADVVAGKLVIQASNDLTVTGVDYTGVYDGNTHYTEATANIAEGTTIRYSIDNGATWSTSYPTITDAGEITVKVKAENRNYETAEDSYTLKVTPRPVTLTSADASKVYDGSALTNSTVTVGGSGFVGGEGATWTVTGSQTEAGNSKNAFTYTLNEGTKAKNYDIETVEGTLTVTKSGALTVEGTDYTGVYDGKAHYTEATANIENGTTIRYSTDNGATWSTDYPTITNVGTVTVQVKAENKNYETATGSYTLTVTPKAVTVTAEDKSKTYGDADPALTAKVEGTIGTDTVAYSLTRAEGEDVGTYAITVTGGANQGNYAVTFVPGNLVISKSGAMTVSGTNYKGTYDALSHGSAATASVTAGTTIRYSTDGGVTWSETVPTITNVGTVAVQVKAENKNYETATGSYTLTVTPKAVTVTAEDKNKTYGDADPALTAKVEGTLGADTVAYSLTRAEGEDVGTYAITVTGGANQGNYAVTFVPGNLVISKSGAMTVSGTNYEGVYDALSHGSAATASVTAGTTVSYSTDNGVTWSETVPTITNVGTVAVQVKAENKNYETATGSYTLTVTPKAVTVTAEDKSKTYGDADPELTAKVEGTLGADTVTYSLTRAEGEDVGTYTITVTGGANQGNYAVTFVPGNLVISKSGAMTVSGTNYEGVYDALSHGSAATASVMAGTTISYSTDNGATWSTDYPTITNVGTVTVQVKAENKNYETATGSYTLTVTPKAVTVTAEDKSKTYGDADPALTAKVEGTIGTDTVTYSLTRAEGENVGTYTITVTGNANQGNYTVTYKNGELTINKRPVTLTSATDSKVYDEKPLTNDTVTIGGRGFVGSDGATFTVTGSQTSVGFSENTFTYTLKEGVNGANYDITKVEGTLTVTASGRLSVEGTDYNGTYDGDAHGSPAAASITEGTKLEYSTDGGQTWSETAPTITNVGTLKVKVRASNANYVTATDEYTLTVDYAQVTVKAQNKTKTYGKADPALTAKVTGTFNGDGITYNLYRAAGEAVGKYTIMASGAEIQGNYRVTYVSGILTINPVPHRPTTDPDPTPTEATDPTDPTDDTEPSVPATTSTEDIPDESVPLAEPTVEIEDEPTPLADVERGVWALVNLILTILTVLASAVLLTTYFGRKKKALEDENGNVVLNEQGEEELEYTRKKKGFWRIMSLIPAIGAVIAFILTEDMRLPMALVDRWTLLMVVIAIIQVVVMVLSKKKNVAPEDETAQANT